MTVTAMVLAAGRGQRLRPLTDHTPKPMLPLAGKPIIEYQLEALAVAGFEHVVVNVAWLGRQIIDGLGDGSRYGLRLEFSDEGETGLETGGGIRKALPMLGNRPFAVVNGDIHTDYDYAVLRNHALSLPDSTDAHLVLVANPEGRSGGDFGLDGRMVTNERISTFSGIGVYRPELFAGQTETVFPLAPLLRKAVDRSRVSGEYWSGHWVDCGTPESLTAVGEALQRRPG